MIIKPFCRIVSWAAVRAIPRTLGQTLAGYQDTYYRKNKAVTSKSDAIENITPCITVSHYHSLFSGIMARCTQVPILFHCLNDIHFRENSSRNHCCVNATANINPAEFTKKIAIVTITSVPVKL